MHCGGRGDVWNVIFRAALESSVMSRKMRKDLLATFLRQLLSHLRSPREHEDELIKRCGTSSSSQPSRVDALSSVERVSRRKQVLWAPETPCTATKVKREAEKKLHQEMRWVRDAEKRTQLEKQAHIEAEMMRNRQVAHATILYEGLERHTPCKESW